MQADDSVIIPVEGEVWKDLFGEGGIELNIFNPANSGAEATFWSIVAKLLNAFYVVLFLATIVFIIIGVIKMQSSMGDQSKYGSGKKTIKNAIIGFLSLGAFVIVSSFITYLIGIGNVFKLAKNLETCGQGESKQTLYQWKQEYPNEYNNDNCICSEDGNWSCSASDEVIDYDAPTDPPADSR